MTAFDAAVLLVADGLVAVGRVLGGLRKGCAAEKHADTLAEAEESRDSWEPDELWAAAQVGPESPKWVRDSVDLNRHSRDAINALTGTRWCYAHKSLSRDCLHERTFCRLRYEPGDPAPGLCDLEEKPCNPVCPGCYCGSARLLRNPGTLKRLLDADDADAVEVEVRSAAVSTPAADNTTVDHLEAAWHYHRPAANYNGDLVWGCEGCNWHGPTIQAHSRHRFHVLADMKNATHRIHEQLGGAS